MEENIVTSSNLPPVQHKDGKKNLWIGILIGFILGALILWAWYQFIYGAKLQGKIRSELLAEVREAQLQQESTVSGTVLSIDKENQVVQISIGKIKKTILVPATLAEEGEIVRAGDSILNEEFIEEDIVVTVRTAGAIFAKLDEQNNELPASLSELKVGGLISIRNQTPIRGLEQINAEKIFVL